MFGTHDLWLFVLSGFLLNITPGPDTLYIVGRSSTQGWPGGAVAALGIGDPGTDLERRVGERVVRALQEFDAAAIEELFSDGLLNVMAAPEFAQSEKLRRVFAALEGRPFEPSA